MNLLNLIGLLLGPVIGALANDWLKRRRDR